MEFKNWFFEQFPEYIRNSDTYLDENQEGLWQRYLSNFGLELDSKLYNYITSITNLIDLMRCDDKYLIHVGSILGFPPSINADPTTYRRLLHYIIAIYKVKGTPVSYKILFSLLGVDITILEEVPKKKVTYDLKNTFYDDGHIYDSECDYCSGYSIAYRGIDNQAVTTQTLQQLQAMIPFIEPINATFKGFVKKLDLEDGLIVTESNNANIL